MKMIKIYLLDDHKVVRDGLKSLLSIDPQFKIAGEESYPDVFLNELQDLDLDILVLDISLPKMSGFEVLSIVKKVKPAVKVVMLSMHDGSKYFSKAMKEGANAYLTKDIEAEEFIAALHEVYKKGSYDAPQLIREHHLKPEVTEGSHLLTPKETEVLQLMARGLSSRQIAAEFNLSSRTVEAHRLNIMKKLGTNNSAETIAIAAKLNLF